MDSGHGQLFHTQLRGLDIAALQDQLKIIAACPQTDPFQILQRLELDLGPDRVDRFFREMAFLNRNNILRAHRMKAQPAILIQVKLDVVAIIE